MNYDPFGRRTAKTINGVQTQYLYDGLNPVQELSGSTPVANLIICHLVLGIEMIFGKIERFGIECQLQERIGSFQICNFRFWFGGFQLGNWNEESVLGVIVHSMQIFLRFRGNRHEEIADRLPAGELFEQLYESAYDEDPEKWRVAVERQYRQRLHLEELGADSTGRDYCILMVEKANREQRVIWKKRNSSELHELTLPPLTVDQVVDEFIEWAEKRA